MEGINNKWCEDLDLRKALGAGRASGFHIEDWACGVKWDSPVALESFKAIYIHFLCCHIWYSCAEKLLTFEDLPLETQEFYNAARDLEVMAVERGDLPCH